jgi:phosphatidylglycerophosphate synthase
MKKDISVRPQYTGTPYQLFIRRAAAPITELLLKTPVTANQVTFFALILYVVPAFLLFQQNLWLNLLAIPFFYFINILDKVDGQLARAKKQTSKTGIFIDGMLHNASIVAVYLPLGLRFYLYENNFSVFLAAVVSIILILCGNYNYLNRTYLVGTKAGDERNRLKVSEKLRSMHVLKALYSIPNQFFPEILLATIVIGLVTGVVLFPLLLYAYLAYNALSFVLYAIVLSRF